MLCMIVERFKDGNAEAIYRRLHEKRYMMPDGLIYGAPSYGTPSSPLRS